MNEKDIQLHSKSEETIELVVWQSGNAFDCKSNPGEFDSHFDLIDSPFIEQCLKNNNEARQSHEIMLTRCG
jgi:hypothetical protein